MSKLIPVKYNKFEYPVPIMSSIKELVGHFDKTTFLCDMNYSLHTEYVTEKESLTLI